MGNFIASHRIGISRAAATVLFVIVIVMSSAEEESIISDILFFCGILLAAMATVGRLWCTLYISGYKNRELITSGPYSVTRNPLYFFSMLGFLGIGLATETFTIPIALLLLFVLIYPSVITKEEKRLKQIFGNYFDEYCSQTPRFWPNFRLLKEPETCTVDPKRFRYAVFDALWFVWLVGIIELVEAVHEQAIVAPLILLP